MYRGARRIPGRVSTSLAPAFVGWSTVLLRTLFFQTKVEEADKDGGGGPGGLGERSSPKTGGASKTVDGNTWPQGAPRRATTTIGEFSRSSSCYAPFCPADTREPRTVLSSSMLVAREILVDLYSSGRRLYHSLRNIVLGVGRECDTNRRDENSSCSVVLLHESTPSTSLSLMLRLKEGNVLASGCGGHRRHTVLGHEVAYEETHILKGM